MQDRTFRVAANSNGIQCLKQCDSKCLETFDAKRKLQGAPFSTQVQQVHQHSSAVIKEKCAGLWRATPKGLRSTSEALVRLWMVREDRHFVWITPRRQHCPTTRWASASTTKRNALTTGNGLRRVYHATVHHASRNCSGNGRRETFAKAVQKAVRSRSATCSSRAQR